MENNLKNENGAYSFWFRSMNPYAKRMNEGFKNDVEMTHLWLQREAYDRGASDMFEHCQSYPPCDKTIKEIIKIFKQCLQDWSQFGDEDLSDEEVLDKQVEIIKYKLQFK